MKGDADGMKVFTGRANPQLAQRICDYLEIPLGRGRTELFPDGELIVRPDTAGRIVRRTPASLTASMRLLTT